MYRLSVSICFLFGSLVIALFTLIIADESFTPSSDKAEILIQDLTSIRAWIVVFGLMLFSWNAARKQPNALVVTSLTALAWVMFLEDYMVLDGILFVAGHPLAQAVIITRPVFMVALTYVAFKQWEVDLL
jgi:FtsH-binding integral membrane protein